MTERFDELKDLLVHELKDLYDAEHRLLEALPEMADHAHDSQLKQAFQHHLRETEGQVQRLEQAFSLLDIKPERESCKAMQGLIKEGKEALKAKGDPTVYDLALVAAAQRVEHYEMAGYGAARTIAQACRQSKVAELMQETLEEEGNADKTLTQCAEQLYSEAA